LFNLRGIDAKKNSSTPYNKLTFYRYKSHKKIKRRVKFIAKDTNIPYF